MNNANDNRKAEHSRILDRLTPVHSHPSKQLDWEATALKAKTMTMSELNWSILDCREAGQQCLAWEVAGFTCLDKSQGYYLDEASVYHTERQSRISREND